MRSKLVAARHSKQYMSPVGQVIADDAFRFDVGALIDDLRHTSLSSYEIGDRIIKLFLDYQEKELINNSKTKF